MTIMKRWQFRITHPGDQQPHGLTLVMTRKDALDMISYIAADLSSEGPWCVLEFEGTMVEPRDHDTASPEPQQTPAELWHRRAAVVQQVLDRLLSDSATVSWLNTLQALHTEHEAWLEQMAECPKCVEIMTVIFDRLLVQMIRCLRNYSVRELLDLSEETDTP